MAWTLGAMANWAEAEAEGGWDKTPLTLGS